MKPLKIGIIEDDLLIAESIFVILQQIGYVPLPPVRNYTDAIKMIEDHHPDFLLIDIKLDGQSDGIDIAEIVNKDYHIPFIFLTANSDQGTITRAKLVKPLAYLLKPFNESDLFSCIEIAFSNFTIEKSTPHTSEKRITSFVLIKEGDIYHKINLEDIVYVESDNVYLNIYTPSKRYLVRNKLENFINDYATGNFIRVHRSYAINMAHLESVDVLAVTVKGKKISLTKNYKQNLLNMINSLK